MLENVTPVVMTFNEEPNIARTLQALAWAKRIIVIDSYSQDRTLEIARVFPQVTIFQREFDHVAYQFDYAIRQAETEWVLAMDADYVLTDEFVSEMATLIKHSDRNLYFVGLKYCVCGKPLRSAILPPREVLFRKDKAKYFPDGHRFDLRVEGECGMMTSFIYHDDRKPLSRWLWAQGRYVVLESKKLRETPPSQLNLADRIRQTKLWAPLLVFIYCFFVKGNIFDGWRGCYYSFQRVLAEILLAIQLIEDEKFERSRQS